MALTHHSSPFLLTKKNSFSPHQNHTIFHQIPRLFFHFNTLLTLHRPPKPTSQGLGFGSSSSNSPKSKSNPVGTKKKQRGKGERASIIRRAPVEKPESVSQQDEPLSQEQIRNESAFLLAWLGFGGVILVEGYALCLVLLSSNFERYRNFTWLIFTRWASRSSKVGPHNLDVMASKWKQPLFMGE